MYIKFFFILYLLKLLNLSYSKFIFDTSILNLRKLQENQTFSEIIVITDINDSYINPKFSPQPYIEYINNETILLKWNKTITN